MGANAQFCGLFFVAMVEGLNVCLFLWPLVLVLVIGLKFAVFLPVLGC
jgi:hypothetical protein